MRGAGYASIFAVTAIVGVVGVVALRQEPKIRANSYVGSVALGGLNIPDAERLVRVWWETEKLKKLQLHAAGATKPLQDETPGQLGITIDDVSTVTKLPMQDIAGQVSQLVQQAPPDRVDYAPSFKPNGADLKDLAKEVTLVMPPAKPVTFLVSDGIVKVNHEQPSQALDVPKVPDAVTAAIGDKKPVELPLTEAAKKVPDTLADSVDSLVATFSTHFATYNRPRCSNIKLASGKFQAVVLMPGDRLSFNGFVGERTLKGGFKIAGVYKNGKHDVGIGGGICQVSTTLYNACLLADLKIRQRSNHSLPVPYVPLGRDATVDYGSLDLIVENSYKTPVVIQSAYEPGKLTFEVFGHAQPGQTVRITQAGLRSWDPGTDTVVDRSLRPGAHHVVEPGNWGHEVGTYRMVYQDGKLVTKEFLGHSSYGGHPKVVAINPAPKPVAPVGVPAPAGQPPATVAPRTATSVVPL